MNEIPRWATEPTWVTTGALTLHYFDDSPEIEAMEREHRRTASIRFHRLKELRK